MTQLAPTPAVPLTTRLFQIAARQFAHPTGWLGWLAGWIMASRDSNQRRNRWTVELLELQPTDRVLELGHGPGLALAEASRHVTEGLLVGIDHSDVMRAQATARNREAIAAGRVQLLTGRAEELPAFDLPFDAALGVNVAMFWHDQVAVLTRVHGLLRPGGRVALTRQPRKPGSTAEDSVASGEALARALHAAGFDQVRVETLPLEPPAVCALGVARERPS